MDKSVEIDLLKKIEEYKRKEFKVQLEAKNAVSTIQQKMDQIVKDKTKEV